MSLQSYADSFSFAVPGGNIVAGVPIDLTAVAGEILDVPTVETVSAPIDIQFVLKHLQIPKVGSEVAWPHDALATGALANITSGLSKAPGIAGPPPVETIEAWAGTVTGMVPVGLRDIKDAIRTEFRWLFTDQQGTELADIAVIGGGLAAPAVTIAVPPAFREMASDNFATELQNIDVLRTIFVSLHVHVRIGTTQEAEFTTPSVPISFIPIPLPTVAGLFRNEQLEGDALLVMAPRGSPIGTAAALVNVLEPLRSLLATVRTAAAVTTWAAGASGLYDTVDALASRIPLTLHVAFRARDEYKDLGKDNFIVVDNWFNTDMEDRGSSALILSATRSISFFQHDDFGGQKLTLNATPDATSGRLGGAAVRRLHVSNPQSDPPGCVSQTAAPDNSWGDKISSYRWGAATG